MPGKAPTIRTVHGEFIIGLMLIALVAAGCNREGQAKGAGQMPPPTVTIAAALEQEVPIYIDEIGRSVASEMVEVQPLASGKITEIHFVDGAEVKKGEMLVTIDPRPYEAALAQARATLAQNEASLALARQEWQNVESLGESNAISKEQFEQRRNAVAVAEAQRQAGLAAVAAAQVDLDYCLIKSPINGRAGQRLVDVGNVVSANSNRTLLTIQNFDPIYADFIIPEQALPAVRENMSNRTLRALVSLPNELDHKPRQGELTFLDNSVDQRTGTLKLRATVPNADRYFWPGQFLQVRLVLATKESVLVPEQSVQIGQQGAFVFIVGEDQSAELRPVTTGQKQDRLIVIEKGIEPGEQVVVTGQMLIRPGGKVAVVQPGQPPDAPPAHGASPTTGPTTGPASASR